MLVQGCLANDAKSQEALYTRYVRRMYAVCLRYARHEAEAQDMLQDGFIRVFGKLRDFRQAGSLEGWVRRIMVTTCINHLRRLAVRMEHIGTDDLPAPAVPEEALATLGLQEVQALLAALPTGYRTVFNLYAVEGYDHAEIAALLGIGESTSRSQLAKARRMLQQRINELDEHVHTRKTSA
jgi:RNA polymerase sigma-70 factor (ECF subfamily)